MNALANKAKKQTTQSSPSIGKLAYWLSATDQQLELGLRTTLSCALADGKTALYLPPDMAANQPDNLHYLHRMAARHNCRLIEDRRSIDVQHFIDLRKSPESPMMQASIELLKQTGMTGSNIKPSEPHRMNSNCIHISMTELIALAVRVVAEGKQIMVRPNPSLVKQLGGDAHPITGYAANVSIGKEPITVAYYHSPKYLSVGYRCGYQYINYIMLGGGPMSNPLIWAAQQSLVESNVRFQLYRSKRKQFDMGLLSISQFIDL